MKTLKLNRLILGCGLLLATSALVAAENPAPSDEVVKAQELAKKLSNPIASLISVPFQFNFDAGYGPDSKGSKFVMNVQPVIPISLNEDWNVISRTIMPVIYQSDVIPNSSQGGLGDFLQSLFFSPNAPVGGMIIGVGPALLLPTATDDRLGAEQWAAGPTAVLLKQHQGWTFGVLANHLWDFAGNDERDDVNATLLQPFVSFSTKTATTFSMNTEATYNWDAAAEPWSIPVNFSVAQLIKIGKAPVQLSGGLRYWAETPANGPSEWGFRFGVTLLFPK
ncbi:MAG: hypothetical protein PCFJNLEI_02556 [Verrucomicrobiae bacterium]|nr:hypothetical protein [Verrucomicrobiae bacterium]